MMYKESKRHQYNFSVEEDFLATLLRNGNDIERVLHQGVSESNFFNKKNKLIAKVALKEIYEIESDTLNASLLKQFVMRDRDFKEVYKSEEELDSHIVKLYSIDISTKDTIELLSQSLIRTSKENLLKLQYNQKISDGAISDESLAELQGTIESLRLSKKDKKFVTLYEMNQVVIGEAEEEIAKIEAGIKVEKGLSTSFAKLDSKTGGIRPGQFIVVGALSGGGKTTFAIDTAVNLSNRYPSKNIAFFSLEMSTKELHAKFVCADIGINISRLVNGEMSRDTLLKLKQYSESGKGKNIHFYETANINVHELAGLCKRKNMELTSQGLEPLSFIVVDYIGLMAPTKGNVTKEATVSEVTRRLKTLAIELQASIMAPAQLNRDYVKRASKDGSTSKFKLSDLRDSGSLEHDANIIIFLNSVPDSNLVIADVAKNRMGATGEITLSFDKEKGVFTESDGPSPLKYSSDAKKTTPRPMKYYSNKYDVELDFDDDRPF